MRTSSVAFLAALAAVSIAGAATPGERAPFKPSPVKADAPAGVRDFFRRVDRDRRYEWENLPAVVENARAHLRELRAERSRDPAAKRRQVEAQQAEVLELTGRLENPPADYLRRQQFENPLSPGEVGVLDEPVHVLSVIDGRAAVVRIIAYDVTPRGDGTRLLSSAPRLAKLRYDTTGWADGDKIELRDFFAVVGTVRLADGPTVVELEAIELGPYLETAAK